ncbi:MAG: hypothetical protein Tsb0019_26770 [Roseibium sp.]
MRRSFLSFLLAAILIWLAAKAATGSELGPADFPVGQKSAVLVSLDRNDRVEVGIFVKDQAKPELSFLHLDVPLKNIAYDRGHLVMTRPETGSTLIAYALQPQLASSLRLLKGEAVVKREQTDDVPELRDIRPTPGLTIYSKGVARVLAWNPEPGFSPTLPLQGSAGVAISRPDMLAFKLPDNYRPGAFLQTGSMFFPTPARVSPLLVFADLPTLKDGIRLRYVVPEPGWALKVADNFEKWIAPLLGVILLIFTKADKVDRALWRPVAAVFALVIAGIYGFFFYRAWQLDESIVDVAIELVGLFGFAALTWIGYVITRRSDKTGGQPGKAQQEETQEKTGPLLV